MKRMMVIVLFLVLIIGLLIGYFSSIHQPSITKENEGRFLIHAGEQWTYEEVVSPNLHTGQWRWKLNKVAVNPLLPETYELAMNFVPEKSSHITKTNTQTLHYAGQGYQIERTNGVKETAHWFLAPQPIRDLLSWQVASGNESYSVQGQVLVPFGATFIHCWKVHLLVKTRQIAKEGFYLIHPVYGLVRFVMPGYELRLTHWKS